MPFHSLNSNNLNSLWGWGKWDKQEKLAKGHMASKWQSWDSNHVRFQSFCILSSQSKVGLLPVKPLCHIVASSSSVMWLVTSVIMLLQTSVSPPGAGVGPQADVCTSPTPVHRLEFTSALPAQWGQNDDMDVIWQDGREADGEIKVRCKKLLESSHSSASSWA